MRPLVRGGGARQRVYPANRVSRKATPGERIKHYAREDRSGCWIWSASLDVQTGYGKLRMFGKTHNAHRVSYEAFVGPVPEGLQLDHLCRVRACVNPAHLEPVTPAENTRRAPSCRARITHCPRGHEYDAANTYVTPRNRRQCRTCNHAKGLLWRAMTPEERRVRKDAGLPVIDLDAYFAKQAA